MSQFAHYQPGEYAQEHIRITPTTLSDGREFFYLDDEPDYVCGKKTRQLVDPRDLTYRFAPHLDADGNDVPYAAPQMRRDPLTGDWIPMATARMNRPITIGPGATATGNPLAARKPGDPYQDGEVPDTDYDVVVFENRFPSMVQVPGVPNETVDVDGSPLWLQRPASGRCEVICFDPNEHGLPADLPVERLRTVVEAWAFRTAELSAIDGLEQVYVFENHGQEIGVSLAHPHGQIYAYPFIAPKLEQELKHTEAYHERTGGNLLADIMRAEIDAGERVIMRNGSWVAYVPAAARWPLRCRCSRCATCAPLTSSTIRSAGTWRRCIRSCSSAATCSSTPATARAWTCRTSPHGTRRPCTTRAASTTVSTCSSSRSAARPTRSSTSPVRNRAWPRG